MIRFDCGCVIMEDEVFIRCCGECKEAWLLAGSTLPDVYDIVVKALP
jgi:hypothetical protein